jgi:glycosyltransferase involved in cell wall biosynthesis
MTVAVVMPAWNEAEGIAEFILEIEQSLYLENPIFIVIDDCSTDLTAENAREVAGRNINITVLTNHKNSGHGPSTLTALRMGLDTGAEIVVAVDGDGQFTGQDIAKVYAELKNNSFDLVEGVRVTRHDPVYRRAASLATRHLVAVRAHELPRDANTPLRAYRSEVLKELLQKVPSETLIPNLFISAISRKMKLSIGLVDVSFIPRRGSTVTGTTWGKSKSYLPSKRFLKFCFNASRDWVTTRI